MPAAACSPRPIAFRTISVVTSEILAPIVLLGKQHFYDAADDRISLDDYISCASCHSDAGSDGRVWDFGGFGCFLEGYFLRCRGGFGRMTDDGFFRRAFLTASSQRFSSRLR